MPFQRPLIASPASGLIIAQQYPPVGFITYHARYHDPFIKVKLSQPGRFIWPWSLNDEYAALLGSAQQLQEKGEVFCKHLNPFIDRTLCTSTGGCLGTRSVPVKGGAPCTSVPFASPRCSTGCFHMNGCQSILSGRNGQEAIGK